MPFRIITLNLTTKNVHGYNYHDNNYRGTMLIIIMKFFYCKIEKKYTKRHIFQFSRGEKKLPRKKETGESFSIFNPQP